jgi:hypothetical protein
MPLADVLIDQNVTRSSDEDNVMKLVDSKHVGNLLDDANVYDTIVLQMLASQPCANSNTLSSTYRPIRPLVVSGSVR